MRQQEQRGLSASTRRTMLFALTAYYRYQKHLGRDWPSPVKDIRPPRPVTAERGFYDDSQADRIIEPALASHDAADRVGGVLMATRNYTGLRLNELRTLRRDQLDLGIAAGSVDTG